MFSHKNSEEKLCQGFDNFFFKVYRKVVWMSGNFLKTICFWENCFFSYIYILSLLFSNTQIKIGHLSRTPNMSLIGEVCNSLGTVSLSLYCQNHWATGELWVNLTSVKGGLINIPFVPARGECNIANDTWGKLQKKMEL